MGDSSAPGYLLPSEVPAPLIGQSLMQFLQQVVVGNTGMPGPTVVPRWQAEPPNLPPQFTAWAAIGIARRTADTFAFRGHVCQNTDVPPGPGFDDFQRTETIYLLCSFYDTGIDGQADALAVLLRDNLQIPDNRAPLLANEMGLVEVTEMVSLPSLTKQRWLYRVDETVVIRRRIRRSYPILNLTSFGVLLNTSIPSTVVITPPRS